jgi:hypothetical protein
MSTGPESPVNIAASVRDRLRNLARQQGADFQLILQRYGAERFLYRLGASPERDRFILKGAMLFRLWTEQEFRSTRDVDFLAFGPADPASIRTSLSVICTIDCAEDGLHIDAQSLVIDSIRDEHAYGGVRAKLKAWLGATRLDLQVDIGTGDVVTPGAVAPPYPTLLGHPPPDVMSYPRETFVAEKLEAIIRLGPTNTRMKDFWDVAAIANQFDFEGALLRDATAATFERRQTPTGGTTPVALTTAFYENEDRIQQWHRFRDRVRPTGPAPITFPEVGAVILNLLGPIYRSVVDGGPLGFRWKAAHGWDGSRGGKK